MTDLSVSDDTVQEVDSPATAPSTLISFALKNGAGEVSVDTARLPDDVYREALLQGLKVLAERAMSKITKEAYPQEAERKAAIKAKAEDNIDKMYRGEVKITGKAAAEKPKGAVMTEAMRLARNLVKDWMKSKKIKISTVKASQITKAAQDMLGNDPSIIETAKANLVARTSHPIKMDLSALIAADPVLVAKAEAKAQKAKADKPLSAKQAGKVAPRAKGAKPKAEAHAGA
jgi:hypothetical protein